MRKVTEITIKAFLAGKTRKVGNTSTDGTILRLHGNRIAEKMPDGSIVANMAGWGTVTTRERLNGLCRLLGLGCMFGQDKFVQYYGSRPVRTTEEIVLIRPGSLAVTIG